MIKVMRYHEDCKGCKLRESDGSYVYCVYVNHLIAKHCPCLLCLVKPLCNKQKCDLRNNIYYELEVGEKR